MANDLRNQTQDHPIRKQPQFRRFGNALGIEKMEGLDSIGRKVNLLIERDKSTRREILDLKAKDKSKDSEILELKAKDKSKDGEIRGLKAKDKSKGRAIRKLKAKDNNKGREIHTLQREITSHMPMKRAYDTIRLNLLEGREEDPPISERSAQHDIAVDQRNEFAHGGNIVVDCSILQERKLDSGPVSETRHRKFLELYGIEFKKIENAITATSPVAKLYDLRAHTRVLKRWKYAQGDNKSLAEKIENECTKEISRWESWLSGKCGTVPEPHVDASGIERLYSEFRRAKPKKK
ncbi:hypothetical protein FQN54_002592 [Arachnomyces sp. PD_36]|nr:hypothetical protein FQN54_002592 [Arachnomyces sp. PD_36]